MIKSKARAVLIYSRWGLSAVTRSYRRARIQRLIRGDAPLLLRFHAPGTGFFAHLTWCLHVAGWAERHNRAFEITCTSPNYGTPDGDTDWLARTITHNHAFPANYIKPAPVKVHAFEELPFFAEPNVSSIAEAHALFHRYFSIAESITSRVQALKKRLFEGRFVIGLHYRGTDKLLEADRISYDDALASARAALIAASSKSASPVLFLATDEAPLVAYATNALAPFTVCTAGELIRSTDQDPIHQSHLSNGLRIADEALLDALLLSECAVLIKTASMLSAWSLVFSGPKPTVLLSRPHENRNFFPDNLVPALAENPGGEARAVAAAFADRKSVSPRPPKPVI
jgi:hypothetical protein